MSEWRMAGTVVRLWFRISTEVRRMRIEARQIHAESGFDRALILWLMRLVGNPHILIRLWNGDEFAVTKDKPVACMEILDRRVVLDLLRSPSVGFGEGYTKGRIEIHGDFLAFVNEITRAITKSRDGGYYGPKIRSLLYALHRNTPARSRHNVHHHYDLGNDFYQFWLDELMVYTCAYYNTPGATLDEAQVAKFDHICRKLSLRPGQKVIDAGCGWGALALHMAEYYGVNVVAYNSSREQIEFARESAFARHLEGQVTFVEDDYRSIDQRCDAFVSVGMLEHVGLANFKSLGGLIRRSLKPEGFGLIHSIGRSFPNKHDPWILKHIFPGGHVPSLAEMMSVFEPQKFSVIDVENLRPHYAKTCADWLAKFDAVADQVEKTYGAEFVRMWRLYLAGSSAGFQSGTLQLYQVLFTPQGNKNVPWSREYQYVEDQGMN